MARNSLNPQGLRVVLVLQGGGALGAYQAGVYQALHEHALVPDWIAGTSIGAINAALIAGNTRSHCLSQLTRFWERVAHSDCVDMEAVGDDQRRAHIRLNTMETVVRGVEGFFVPRGASAFAFGMPVAPENASFYDTEPLEATLRELVDFDFMNTRIAPRLTISAVNVTSGQLVHFDSRRQRVGPEHVRASGSLPPGFPPVRIDGELYWDGGLYSNTPLEAVLDELPLGDTLCFVVDLWSPAGAPPMTYEEVRTRQKDVTYASRTERHLADYARVHALQSRLRDLYDRLPPELRTCEDERAMLALGCGSVLHIVRLRYAGHDWHMASKDINFSKGSIEWRWDQGYADTQRALRHAGWLRGVPADTAVVVHETPGHDSSARQAD
ncbi:patatin-like phospholipase family protein [Massilia agilis]|uniref:Patatin-like phospholipase family protein n=1 Tax=Massilia agilis TaxID=1811226 RepID=A0ABT2DBR6_9BURK|nr:patatin-like phospholipase family protein [Massilia agilis]MCS0808279.1 patatin-like phospholipase family protein [Massilia agilis]